MIRTAATLRNVPHLPALKTENSSTAASRPHEDLLRMDLPAVDCNFREIICSSGRLQFPGNYKSLLVSGRKSWSAVRKIPGKFAAFLSSFGSGLGSGFRLRLVMVRGWVGSMRVPWFHHRKCFLARGSCPTPGRSILSRCQEDSQRRVCRRCRTDRPLPYFPLDLKQFIGGGVQCYADQ